MMSGTIGLFLVLFVCLLAVIVVESTLGRKHLSVSTGMENVMFSVNEDTKSDISMIDLSKDSNVLEDLKIEDKSTENRSTSVTEDVGGELVTEVVLSGLDVVTGAVVDGAVNGTVNGTSKAASSSASVFDCGDCDCPLS